MSWMEQINTATAVWRGVVSYAEERISELTAVCTSPKSSDSEIRQAQAGIAEMQALLSVPDRLRLHSQQGAAPKRTHGY